MPIDEIINDGTNMVVGAAQGAVADQQPETIVVTADPNLEQPLDIEQLSPQKAKDVNWYNKAIDVFNLEKGTKLPKVADAVEIADDDYMAVTKHFNDRVVNDYNTTNDKLKLGLPLVTDISEIKPENSQKIDEAKVISHINKANKELKMAQDVLGGELLKFEPFRSLDDMRNRADDFMAKLEKATNAKDKNKLLSDVNKYITNANKEGGFNVRLFDNPDDAKKAITVGKDGVVPLAKKFEDLSSTKAVGDELRSGLLNPMATDLPEKNLLDRQKAMYEKEMADLERSKKRTADIAILSKKLQKDGTPFLESTYLKFLNNGATQYASQSEADAEVVRLRTENPNIKGVGVRQVSDEYGNTKWQVSIPEEADAQYYKKAQDITAFGALEKQKQANELVPLNNQLRDKIKSLTMQGLPVPQQLLAEYEDVNQTIQDLLTASNILTDVASENYVKYNNLESKRGGLLSAITFEGVESFNRITEGIMTLGLTIPELMMLPIPSNVAENTDFMKATQKGKQNVGEFFEKRTRYLQDVFGIAPQYRGGAVTEAVSGAVGILPYILGGELAVPFMVATGVDANLKALEGEKGLSTNEKNLIALVKGSIGAYVMSKGLDVIGGHTAINRIAYNTMKDLPVNFTGKTLQNLVGKEVTQYISNTAATSGSFGILNPASGVADIGITELAKVATDGRFNPQASHDVLKDLAESFVHGLGTGVVLGGVTGSLKLGADKISNEREFRQMDAMVQDPSLIPILKLKLGQQVVDKKISADEYKKAIANINSVANIASQIPKDFSNSSRYQSFKLLKENAEYEKQKAGLAPVYIKRIDGLIEANNAELIKIADNESVKSIPNDTQNPETTNSESTTTDGTNEVTTQETKVMDDGVKVENDVVSLAAKIRKLKTQKGALNSDITLGLRDLALEEIAQLVEDGITVIDAVKKVLADVKYSSLNKDEIEKSISTTAVTNDALKDVEGATKKLFHSSVDGIENIREGALISELGIHFGTKETAETLNGAKGGTVKEYDVYIKNPIEVPDFARWEAFVVSRKLLQMGILTEAEHKKINKQTGNDKERELLKVLKSKGYDGFVYDNAYEGGGKSYVAFDKSQVKPTTALATNTVEDKSITTKGNELADKIRLLKSPKGSLQSDITGGLKDYALEEIAQLIEDGTVVIEAIRKVLANSKYASLNKDEIRNLVFSVNPLTEKDFERNDSEKVVDRNKRLEADLKQRGYTQNEIDYILRGGVDRIEKVDTVREETKVVDNLNKILKSVQAKAKDMPLKEAVDKAIEQVQGDWVKGKEIILENAIRKFKKEHEIAVTNPTDRAVKPKPIMITVDEKKALTDQIKLEVKAATEGAKSITDGFKEVEKIVNEILKQHKTTISTRQLNAIQKRMAYLKVGSNESVRKYVDYIEKVLANAEYADQLASVKSTNKKLKKALKNDKIPASVRATANDFIKLDPADVENLNKHEVYANELLEAMKSGGIKVQDGNVIDKTRKAADLSKIDNYIEKEMALAEKRAEQSMNEEYQTTAEAEDNTDEIKAYVQRKFDNMKAMVGRMLERGVDMDGNPIDFTPEEVSMIKKVMGMKLDQLDNIKDWYEATEALDHLLTNGDLGLIPHILNKYQNAVTVKKGTQTLINKMAGNISLLPITKFFAQMEKLVTTTIPFGKRNPKDSYGTKIFFDNSSFRRWDNLVKNFKDYGIYESTFYHLAKAYANYKTLVRQMDAQRISKELFASNGYDQKKTLESKFKITAYLRQLEFESNPESKTNKPAIDYLNATIEAAENLNHPIQGKALDMLKDVVSKHTVDGQISLESLRNSFTQGEKKAIADLQKTYKALAPYHNKVSLAIRNKAFTAIENYTHISAYGTKTKGLSATETKKNEYLSVLQGTKSGTIEERSGATSPINLDPFATANKAIRDVMLDYFMTNPFRNVEKILDNFAKYSIDELKKYPRGTAEYENALKRKNIADAWIDIYSDARENMLGRSYFETNPFKEFMQLAAKRAVEFTLGKPDRLLAELFSNMGFVMSSATKEFALGSTKYLKYNGGEIQAKIMENVQSSATERLHPHGGIATSVMDTQDFDIAVADDQNLSSPVRRKALQFYYNTLAKGIGTGQMINEGMITSGDLLIARPIWTGTMATEFKKITGKDIDFDKISENDIEYMDANEEAIDKARTVADRKVTDAAASKNPFETAPKMSNRSTQILQALNTYMRGFNMTEYELASDALMHLVKGGKMSAKDATRILSGISARAGLYKAVQAKAATAMMAAIMGGWAMLQNDEKKTEVDKLIGNMGDDTPENRRKVAAKLLELFATSNPNLPELAGMGEVGDALKTTDEETVKFWKRATEEPNTFIEDVVKGIGQQYLSLLTQRNFGNIVQGFLTAPLFEEYVNKKLRDDYDPYKDSYLYSKLPDTGKKNWLIRSIEANLGAYGLPLAMLMDITVAGIELRINIKKLDAVNEELKKHIGKVPLEKNKLEDWYDLKDRQKSLEKKIEDSYKSIAKEVSIAAGMGTGAIPALKNIDKAMDKIMQDAYKLPKDWKKIQEKIEAIKNGVSPEDIMNAENKQKAVSEIYDVIEPGEKMPDIYDDAIKKVLEK